MKKVQEEREKRLREEFKDKTEAERIKLGRDLFYEPISKERFFFYTKKNKG